MTLFIPQTMMETAALFITILLVVLLMRLPEQLPGLGKWGTHFTRVLTFLITVMAGVVTILL